ncbi:MAG TPA: DUF1206 domain-containing protein [Pyrinomonadaceae bacterium]|nr:DUF1206 domain-containing protein [Pyrinomonadaceae bacterium]
MRTSRDVWRRGGEQVGVEDVLPEEAKEQARRVARAAHPWLVRLGRFGYAAKGVVYVIIGAMAAFGAVGSEQPKDSRGALTELLRQPFGSVLLSVVAVGLAGYALWRLTMGLKDTEQKGSDLKGLAVRFGYGCIGLVYLGLSYSAVQLVLGNGAGKGSDETSKEWTARFMALPFGRWLVGLAGLCVIGFGAWQCYKGLSARFRKRLMTAGMRDLAVKLATRAGQVGLTARGVVFGIVGAFLVQAALHARAHEARGLSGALRALEQQAYGPWLLGAVALGLVVYGLYMFVEARYRRMIID